MHFTGVTSLLKIHGVKLPEFASESDNQSQGYDSVTSDSDVVSEVRVHKHLLHFIQMKTSEL